MARPRLSDDRVSSAVAEKMSHWHDDVLREVIAAVDRDDVVVVGMKWNPHVPKARAALTEAGVAHTYLEYGSYLSGWKPRLAIKLWSGFPTFPQVFVKGVLIGGNSDVRKALADGSLRARLSA
jgi:glutaredoxin-related protein